MDYLRFDPHRYTCDGILDIIYNLQQELFDGSHIVEFKGTDGVVAFFMNNEDLIIEFLEGRRLMFSGILDTVNLVFLSVLEQEEEKWEAIKQEDDESEEGEI